ncbi:hypothetical protein ACFQ1B_18710 [Streptomyces mexicanus]
MSRARVLTLHEATGGLELGGRQHAARGDTELGQAAPDPYQGTLTGVEVVVHLAVGSRGGQNFLPVHGSDVDPRSTGDLDGIEPGHPGRFAAPQLGAGTEERLLRRGGPEQSGDAGSGLFGSGLDGSDERSGVDGDGLSAAVAAGQAVLDLFVGRADHRHPPHRTVHPFQSATARSGHL